MGFCDKKCDGCGLYDNDEKACLIHSLNQRMDDLQDLVESLFEDEDTDDDTEGEDAETLDSKVDWSKAK